MVAVVVAVVVVGAAGGEVLGARYLRMIARVLLAGIGWSIIENCA